MDDFLKKLLVVLIIIYIISPIDLVPGPIDDVIVALAGIIGTRRLEEA